jgi:hypothetical protein
MHESHDESLVQNCLKNPVPDAAGSSFGEAQAQFANNQDGVSAEGHGARSDRILGDVYQPWTRGRSLSAPESEFLCHCFNQCTGGPLRENLFRHQGDHGTTGTGGQSFVSK